ncbi:MAG: response regulator, partial [Nitrospiraceae bacterium]
LLDLRMPEMDGIAVLREIRAIDPVAAVMILAGGVTDVQENQARELRVTDFLRKGLSLNVLVGAVDRVAQQPATAQSVPLPARGPVSLAQNGDSILVVDDDPLILDLLVQFLTLRGYRVRAAKNGRDALALVRQESPQMILLDIIMPGMNGVEVLRELRAQEFAGSVVALTGAQSEELLQEAWNLGLQEVVGKPIDLDRLLLVIQLGFVLAEC